MSISLSGSLLLTGSLTVTGEITMSGSIASASYATTASYALTASYVEGGGSSVMVADTGTCSTIRCGVSNCASGNYSFVGGGASGSAAACHSFIGGGIGNKICSTATCASIVGGYCNTISAYAYYSTIGGGYCNTLSNNYSFIGNGSLNTVSGLKSAIVTGAGNVVCGYNSFIGSGTLNTISLCGCHSSIGGGHSNTVSGKYSFVGSGRSNTASGKYSAIVGGNANCACGCNSFIGGGYSNFTVTCFSVVGGGYNNVVFGCHSFVGSGRTNVVCGAYSGVLGGCNNTVTGTNSFVLGSNLSGSANDTTYINNLVANGTTQQLTGSVTITGSLTVSDALTGYNYTFTDGQYIRNSNQSNANGTLYLDSSNLYIRRADTGANLMFVSSSGNVGIGTTNPVAKLQVYGTETSPSLTSNTGIFTVNSTSTVQLNIGGNNSSPYPIWLQTRDTSGGSNVYPLLLNPLGGNVGIGTTSPSNILTLNQSNSSSATSLEIINASNASTTSKTAQVLFQLTDTGNTPKQVANIVAYPDGVNVLSGGLAFGTRNGDANPPAERMRLTNLGTLMVGTTSAPAYQGIFVGGSASSLFSLYSNYSSNAVGFEMSDSANTLKVQFFGSNGNYYFAGSNLSDRRLKSNIVEMTEGLSKISQLKPSTFTYDKNPHILKGGFIAQEVSEAIPEFVTIPQDENEMMGVDYFGILALAVKAIQEQQATIQELTTRLTALENK